MDQTDRLSYKAYLLPDQDTSIFLERLETLLDSLVGLDGARGANVMVQIVPTRNRLQRESTRLWGESFRSVYQCAECGRLNVESLDGQRDYWFLPEDEATPTNLLESTFTQRRVGRETD
ncbi:hypothetical protein V3W47_06240 [Deinococcus sp. YIM 134068]|uniref:hypothetical protein n=1 Tax=Deinococcus lichenicola TaxID=3118910 RepID=UPI002F9555FB